LDPLNWKDGKEESSTVAAATGDYHNDTYGAEENRVQVNAEPVYWRSFDPVKLSSSDQVFNGDSYDKNYAGFFIIEAIWNEKDKETDLVYLIAGETEEVNSVEEVK
jgi:hypothetical protein